MPGRQPPLPLQRGTPRSVAGLLHFTRRREAPPPCHGPPPVGTQVSLDSKAQGPFLDVGGSVIVFEQGMCSERAAHVLCPCPSGTPVRPATRASGSGESLSRMVGGRPTPGWAERVDTGLHQGGGC